MEKRFDRLEEKMKMFMESMNWKMDGLGKRVFDTREWVAGELFARDAEAEFEEEGESEVESGGEPEGAIGDPEELRQEAKDFLDWVAESMEKGKGKEKE